MEKRSNVEITACSCLLCDLMEDLRGDSFSIRFTCWVAGTLLEARMIMDLLILAAVTDFRSAKDAAWRSTSKDRSEPRNHACTSMLLGHLVVQSVHWQKESSSDHVVELLYRGSLFMLIIHR